MQSGSRFVSAEGSRRAFYKEFQKVIEAADVVIQVLDARDPLGSRCLDVERMVLKAGATKRIILLLNKIGTHRPPSGVNSKQCPSFSVVFVSATPAFG